MESVAIRLHHHRAGNFLPARFRITKPRRSSYRSEGQLRCCSSVGGKKTPSGNQCSNRGCAVNVDNDSILAAREFTAQPVVEPGLIPSVKQAIDKGFHIFGLQPKEKKPLIGSSGFKDSKAPSDVTVLVPWNQDPSRNIGIDLGASDLCVLDFDNPDGVPAWISAIRTYKVRTARGVHVYFRGARPTTGLFVDGAKVGDIKSIGGYVLAEGSVHPDGPVYTVIDDSGILPLPDISSLLKRDKERVNVSVDGPMIPYGSHDIELFRSGSLLRNAGMSYEEIREALIGICERRCVGHGADYLDMCERKAKQACKYPVGQASLVPTLGAGADQSGRACVSGWRSEFRNLSEMEDGDIVMIIDGVLQGGTCFIGANPGHGKTLVALAFAKAICLGEPLFGIPEYTVNNPRNVIYLIPESADRPSLKRGKAFRWQE